MDSRVPPVPKQQDVVAAPFQTRVLAKMDAIHKTKISLGESARETVMSVPLQFIPEGGRIINESRLKLVPEVLNCSTIPHPASIQLYHIFCAGSNCRNVLHSGWIHTKLFFDEVPCPLPRVLY